MSNNNCSGKGKIDYDSSYSKSCNCGSKIKVNFSIRYSTATLYFTLEKTYDSRGAGQSDSCKVGWKMYDSDGYIVDSGTFYSDSMKVGDKQKNGKSYVYNLEKGKTYRLEIMNVN